MRREKNYSWKGQLAVGKAGEEVVYDWLQYTTDSTVVDVRGDRSYQADDIDFVVVTDDKPVLRAEVKTDTYNNEFVFFELHTAEHNPGALFKSRAHVWYIYKPARNLIVEVDPARVATHIWLSERQIVGGPYKLYPVFNDKKKVRAWGVKLPISVLEQLGGTVYLLPEAADAEPTT